MRLALNYHNMMQEAIGENGFTKDELCALPIEAAIWGMKTHRGNMKCRELLYLLEAATGFVGDLLNINAFDQPCVEEGKKATYALLGKPGFAQKKAELDAAPQKKEEYIVR